MALNAMRLQQGINGNLPDFIVVGGGMTGVVHSLRQIRFLSLLCYISFLMHVCGSHKIAYACVSHG